jgi:hypothetical protein
VWNTCGRPVGLFDFVSESPGAVEQCAPWCKSPLLCCSTCTSDDLEVTTGLQPGQASWPGPARHTECLGFIRAVPVSSTAALEPASMDPTQAGYLPGWGGMWQALFAKLPLQLCPDSRASDCDECVAANIG